MLDNWSDYWNKEAKKSDNLLITYDTIISLKEYCFYNTIIEPKFDYYNKYLRLDLFKLYKEPARIRILLNRKEKNFVDWLARDENSKILMHKELDNVLKYTHSDEFYHISSFAIGLKKFMINDFVNRITIMIDFEDTKGVSLLCKLYSEYQDKIKLVNFNEVNFLDQIKKHDVIITDCTDILDNNIESIKGKTVCFPFTGYNFIIDEKTMVMSKKMLLSKDKFEFKSVLYSFNLGFIDLFKITNAMYERINF